MQREDLIKKYVNQIAPKKFTYDTVNSICKTLINDIQSAFPNGDLYFETAYDSGIYKIYAPQNRMISLVLQENDTKLSIRNLKGSTIIKEYVLSFDGVNFTSTNNKDGVVETYNKIQHALENTLFKILLDKY